MKNSFTLSFTTQLITTALLGLAFFTSVANQASASVRAEQLSRMESQLNTASAALAQLASLHASGKVLGVSATALEIQAQVNTLMIEIAKRTAGGGATPTQVSAELQAQITALMAQIAASQNTSVRPVKPILGVEMPFVSKVPFFKMAQETKEITIGMEDVAVAKITVPKTRSLLTRSAEDRYLNQVLVRVTPGSQNENVTPWDSFEEMSIFVGGYKVKAVDVQDQSKWKVITKEGGRKVYGFTVFNGNQKLPNVVNKDVTATLAVSTSNEQEAGDTWSMWIPKNGVTIWTPSQKHTKYGPTKVFKYKMVAGDEDDVLPKLSSAIVERVSFGYGVLSDLSVEFAQASFDITIAITADDHDVFIPKTVASKNGINEAGFLVGFIDKNGRDVSSNIRASAVASSANTDTKGRFVVSEGETEEFTIKTTLYADKKIDNNYTFVLKAVNHYLNPDINPEIQKASFTGGLKEILGDTGQIIKGVFVFKG